MPALRRGADAGRGGRAGPGRRIRHPLYVCDEEDVRSRCREYLEAFGPEGRVYAAKAFCSRAVLRWVSEEGLGVDVCTGGELEVALSAGCRRSRSPCTATTRCWTS